MIMAIVCLTIAGLLVGAYALGHSDGRLSAQTDESFRRFDVCLKKLKKLRLGE